MTDTTDLTAGQDASADARSARTRGGLAGMNVVDLKTLATQLGIRGTARMRKDDLVASIVAHQAGSPAPAREVTPAPEAAPAPAATAAPQRGTGRRAHAGVTTPAPVTDPTPPREPGPDRPDGQPAEASRASEPREPREPGESASAPEASRPIETSEPQEKTPSVDENRRRAELQEELARAEQRARTEQRTRPDRGDGPSEPRQDARQDARQEPREDPSAAQLARQEARQTRREAQAARQEGQTGQNGQGGQNGQAGQAGQSGQSGSQGGQQPTRGAGSAQDRQGRAAGQGDPSGRGGATGAPALQVAPSHAAPAGSSGAGDDEDDDRPGGRRRNRQRSRDRKRRGVVTGTQELEPELQVADDDVLVPVAGILDVLDNYAFVRTSGYLPGPSDVYVPLGLVKKHGLRKGDAVTGAVKALREGEQPQQGGSTGRQKFNALVRLDSVNGAGPDDSHVRSDFAKLTPLYPHERLRLETETSGWTARVIDLVAPVGKGQRGLVMAPTKAGKTVVLQAIANAVTANNPECHLMVVLVDERPEEVTDMQRAVKGEVIASTFDRPAEDHTTVAELAIERAKRLVELGHDVVVLLDSLTKLGRAYNLAAPASGRILAGGVDSAALHPPKKIFGAARNIENGGSLTIIATALVDTGSRMDEVILEEFRGTGNMELTLSGELAERRTFPAIDVARSGTRREELLMSEEELAIVWKLRRVLGGLEPQEAMERLLQRLKKTRSNIEFLRQVQLTSASVLGDGDA